MMYNKINKKYNKKHKIFNKITQMIYYNNIQKIYQMIKKKIRNLYKIN